MLIVTMRITQLRQADLNLLVVFIALAEERNVSRAARRLLLSQPAVTRALQRLRDLFHDDLLVRVSGNYGLTPKGEHLLAELESALPRLDRLLAGPEFDPVAETAKFRLVGTDYAAHIIGVPLAKYLLAAGSNLSLEMSPISSGVFDAMERARVDLLLHANDENVPAHLSREILFEEEFVCVVGKDNPLAKRLTLNHYLKAPHVGIGIFEVEQTIPEQRLKAEGLKRHCPVRVAQFAVAMKAVIGTSLIATIPKRLAMAEPSDSRVAVVKPPKLMHSFTYLMAWHPRMENDAAHIWLRQAVRESVKDLSPISE